MKWINVKDRLPKDARDIIFFQNWENKVKCFEIGFYEDRVFFTREDIGVECVTHWMYLINPEEEF